MNTPKMWSEWTRTKPLSHLSLVAALLLGVSMTAVAQKKDEPAPDPKDDTKITCEADPKTGAIAKECEPTPPAGYFVTVTKATLDASGKSTDASDTTFDIAISCPTKDGMATTVALAGGATSDPVEVDSKVACEVNETVPEGWVLDSIICDASGNNTVAGSNTAPYPNCVVTNKREIETGKITIIKETLPDGAGGSFVFTLIDSDGNPVQTSKPVEDNNDTNNGVVAFPDVPAGYYTLDEGFGDGTNPDGWVLAGAVCTDDKGTTLDATDGVFTGMIEVNKDDDIVCTITNQAPGMLKVVKEVRGGKGPETFSFYMDDTEVATLGHLESWMSGPLTAGGGYSVYENDPGKLWDVIGRCDGAGNENIAINFADGIASLDDIVIQPGLVTTCTFVNVHPGYLTVTKECSGGGGKKGEPATDVFGFTVAYGETDIWSGDIMCGESVSMEVAGGLQYSVSEADADGWTLAATSCGGAQKGGLENTVDDVLVRGGERVECTFINVADEKPVEISTCGLKGQPACEEPIAECGGKDQPACEEPVVECGGKDQPACEEPIVECGGKDQPACDVPVIECGGKDQPACDVPVIECGGKDQPACDVPVIECGGKDQPACVEPVIECGGKDQPACEEPVIECGGKDQPACETVKP